MNLVKEALSELADERYQTRVWLATEGEVSSPIEAFSQLFDDSGLADAFDSGTAIFNTDIDEKLRALEEQLKPLTAGQRLPQEVLEDSALTEIRSMAAQTLFALTRHEARKSRRSQPSPSEYPDA